MRLLLVRGIAACVVLGGSSVAVEARAAEANRPDLIFSCTTDNDLYRVLTAGKARYPRYATAAEAVGAASSGAGVLILADGYPQKTTEIPPIVFEKAKQKGLRLYVEYPTAIPGLELGKPCKKRWHRTVVASDAFGPKLKRMRILQIHDCRMLPVKADASHLVSARVAGFDTALYGLPKEALPILLEHPRGDILVATTKLSQFVTGRYSPSDAWGPVWEMILGWLARGRAVPKLAWTPTVRPAFGRDEPLPKDAQLQAIRRGTKWYVHSRMLLDEAHKDDYPAHKARPDWPIGDGTYGILEGHRSKIYHDGSQPIRNLLRADCNAESALPLALQGVIDNDEESRKIAKNLSDFVYFNSPLQQGSRNDPKSPSYGLLSWWCKGDKESGIYYSNDNAKALVATMGTAALLNSDRWDEPMLRCILGNFRTASAQCYRFCQNEAQLQEKGWRHFARRHFVYHRPQHMAWIWSCYLWLYDKTKYDPLLDRTREAIRLTMQAYPEHWYYSNQQRQMERARMLLALAWLLRVDDTPEHRAWLQRIAGDLIADQAPCGAIREQVAVGLKSNEEYGSREMALVQSNTDPVADMLYVMPNVLFGLNEAVAATGDEKLARAADRVAEFLIRIQARSEAHPELDGAWFRAFDFGRWDYWAVNGDAGWGAWCTETGWAQSYIVASLALREMHTSLWELTAKSKIAEHFEKYRKLMHIDEACKIAAQAEATSGIFKHAALYKEVTLARPAHRIHPGGGPPSLVDGKVHKDNQTSGLWSGFRGDDLEATVDLGTVSRVCRAGANFQQSVPIGVFLPVRLEVSVSNDGKQFRKVATVTHNIPLKKKGPLTKTLMADLTDVEARYVKIHAVNIGLIPEWHPAPPDRPAWMFVDEIIVH